MSKIIEKNQISSDMNSFEMEIGNIKAGLSFDERIRLQRDLEDKDSSPPREIETSD